ncbi:hypothetical protein EBH_0017300 [Eimeria brunetti]|uniref:Uncharacterized protein n=1 Tax=Eimeria brunetti TaxID=51314 RepID=U6LBY4_9EIME|nr:hypothetical protein EBH_0017300 [Eimeria brunetti]
MAQAAGVKAGGPPGAAGGPGGPGGPRGPGGPPEVSSAVIGFSQSGEGRAAAEEQWQQLLQRWRREGDSKKDYTAAGSSKEFSVGVLYGFVWWSVLVWAGGCRLDQCAYSSCSRSSPLTQQQQQQQQQQEQQQEQTQQQQEQRMEQQQDQQQQDQQQQDQQQQDQQQQEQQQQEQQQGKAKVLMVLGC